MNKLNWVRNQTVFLHGGKGQGYTHLSSVILGSNNNKGTKQDPGGTATKQGILTHSAPNKMVRETSSCTEFPYKSRIQ